MQPTDFAKIYTTPNIGQILVIFDAVIAGKTTPEGRIIVMFSNSGRMHTAVLEGEDPYSAYRFFSVMTEDYTVELINRAILDSTASVTWDGSPTPINIDDWVTAAGDQ